MPPSVETYEKLGAFYLGRPVDKAGGEAADAALLYDSKDLLTHALCVGMTGSGKTGLCVCLLEEAALDGVPALIIDPKGDLGNLMLTFPDLAPEDFRPWVDEAAAGREGKTPDDLAAAQAALWRKGLAEWGQDGERIARLRQAADVAVYTPGSDAGLPVSILASFAAPPPALIADGDLLRERVSATAGSLLGLLGIDADPVRSREHILLSTLLDRAWREGRDLDLGGLIQGVQEPPVERVGVMPLESFYPAKERFELAMALNNLLAAPGFAAWLEGEPLDVDRLLYTAEGRPRLAILSIAHLGDAERMFFVSLLLNQVLAWVRTRPGTSSLRALLYMDEIFGYLPPVAEPPSKRPLLTLLKQARAYGLGVVLATQNPVDLDYKALSNVGTWFLGRLQTERDQARVLDGLQGASGEGFDRGELERLLAGLGKRVFLLHNVHEDGPVLFRSRWAMSYLRGPLTRLQIARLMAGRKAAAAPPAAPSATASSAVAPAAAGAASAAAAPPAGGSSRPVLSPEVPERFLPPATASAGEVYRPLVGGAARVHFVDARRGVEHREEPLLLAPVPAGDGDPDWSAALDSGLPAEAMAGEPAAGITAYASLPAAAGEPGSYRRWKKALSEALYRERRLELFESPLLEELSRPGESERDFRIRLADEAREARDREVDELRAKYASRLATQSDRIRRAEQRLGRERDQVRQAGLKTAVSLGTTLLGALLGRKRLSSTTLSRAGTAASGFGRSLSERQDVERAEESLAAESEKLRALEAECEREVAELAQRFDPQAVELESRTVKPRRSDVEVRTVALVWAPYRDGAPAWGGASAQS